MKKTEKNLSHSASNASLAHGVGRRKSSVARVWFKRGSGNFVINESAKDVYFDTYSERLAANKVHAIFPDMLAGYDIMVNVQGGGKMSQAGAVCLGVARALLQASPDAGVALRAAHLLTVDSRVKERKKYGRKAARRSFQFVKR